MPSLNCVRCVSCHVSGSTPLGTPTFSDHGNESLSSLMKWMALGSDGQEPGAGDPKAAAGKKKKKSFGSLSRVFGRGRSRRSIALPHSEGLFEGEFTSLHFSSMW